MKEVIKKIDQGKETSDYNLFLKNKISITEILSVETVREIDLIINEIALFKTILNNILNEF